MFSLQKIDPETYRQNTRKSSFILIVIFASLSMLLAQFLVSQWGTEEGSNFKLNLAGVLLGLAATWLLLKLVLSKQPFMRDAVYGWHLKRHLMLITNKMHVIKEKASNDLPQAVQLLNFYYHALEHMHRLEGNDGEVLELKVDQQAVQQQMQTLGLDAQNTQLQLHWFEAL